MDRPSNAATPTAMPHRHRPDHSHGIHTWFLFPCSSMVPYSLCVDSTATCRFRFLPTLCKPCFAKMSYHVHSRFLLLLGTPIQSMNAPPIIPPNNFRTKNEALITRPALEPASRVSRLRVGEGDGRVCQSHREHRHPVHLGYWRWADLLAGLNMRHA